jgi:hypothetical protein
MQQTFEDPEINGSKPRTSTFTIAMGVVVALAILVSLWFLFEPLQSRRATSPQEQTSVMNPVEQEYTKKIEISNIAMSRAENFLHQEVTTLAGELYNGGAESVASATLTAEFSDDMSQIVLRETRRVLASSAAPLHPGERRAFEISFEHIPASWNMQAPTVRVTHLQLSPPKK